MFFQLAAPDDTWARAVTILLQGAIVIAALAAAGAAHKFLAMATVVYVLIAIVASAAIGLGVIGPAVPRLLSLGLVLLAPVAIVIGARRALVEEGHVSIQTVSAALGLYLLIGLGFAFAYNVVQDFAGEAFFNGNLYGTPADFLYFSLVTITTTGYGDFTAAEEIGRAMAAMEALAGQIYLVTVISLAVANLKRHPPGSRHRRA